MFFNLGGNMNKVSIIETIKEENVKFIKLMFVDPWGCLQIG